MDEYQVRFWYSNREGFEGLHGSTMQWAASPEQAAKKVKDAADEIGKDLRVTSVWRTSITSGKPSEELWRAK